MQNQTLLIPVCSHEKLPLIPGTNTAFSERRQAAAARIAPFHIPPSRPVESLSVAIIQDSGLGFHETTSEMPLDRPPPPRPGEGARMQPKLRAAGLFLPETGARLAALRGPDKPRLCRS